MWNSLFIALALILIIEGILPFLNPAGLRKSLLLITQMDDTAMRIGGLVSMVLGIALLYLVH